MDILHPSFHLLQLVQIPLQVQLFKKRPPLFRILFGLAGLKQFWHAHLSQLVQGLLRLFQVGFLLAFLKELNSGIDTFSGFLFFTLCTV